MCAPFSSESNANITPLTTVEFNYVIDNLDIGLEFESRFRSVELNTKYKNFILSLEADNILKPSLLSVSIAILY